MFCVCFSVPSKKSNFLVFFTFPSAFFSLPATCVCVCLVAQSCPTLWNLMDCSLPGCSVHWDSPGKNTGVGCHALLQGISQPRDRTQVSGIAGKFFTIWATREALRLHERTHPPSSFILFPRIVCISSKASIYHMPVTHPPIFVFNTNKHPPQVSPFPGVTILYHIIILFISKIKTPRDNDFLLCQACFISWAMQYAFASWYK